MGKWTSRLGCVGALAVGQHERRMRGCVLRCRPSRPNSPDPAALHFPLPVVFDSSPPLGETTTQPVQCSVWPPGVSTSPWLSVADPSAQRPVSEEWHETCRV